MTAKELAKLINGRACGKELTAEERRLARESGLAVAYISPDDQIELEGAVQDEIDCGWGNGTFYINRRGFVCWQDDDGDYCESCPYFRRELASAVELDVKWASTTWRKATLRQLGADIPHEEFNVLHDEAGMAYGGIVFRLEDLPPLHE